MRSLCETDADPILIYVTLCLLLFTSGVAAFGGAAVAASQSRGEPLGALARLFLDGVDAVYTNAYSLEFIRHYVHRFFMHAVGCVKVCVRVNC